MSHASYCKNGKCSKCKREHLEAEISRLRKALLKSGFVGHVKDFIHSECARNRLEGAREALRSVRPTRGLKESYHPEFKLGYYQRGKEVNAEIDTEICRLEKEQ